MRSARSCAGGSSTPTCRGPGPTRSTVPLTKPCGRWRSTWALGTKELFRAWAEGRTGYPIVDAGMRQLLAEGWMHNRVRMIVASFLVKDLHLDWARGARWFMSHRIVDQTVERAEARSRYERVRSRR
jgi:FAD binding domain of DNA photolyase